MNMPQGTQDSRWHDDVPGNIHLTHSEARWSAQVSLYCVAFEREVSFVREFALQVVALELRVRARALQCHLVARIAYMRASAQLASYLLHALLLYAAATYSSLWAAYLVWRTQLP